MSLNYTKKAFSIIELLVVMAVFGVIIAATLPQFSKIKENQVLKSAVVGVLSSVDKARSETLSSLNSSTYGVRFESAQIVIFKGDTYSAGASDNEVITIISPANISSVTLGGVSGATGDFYFKRLSGAPSKTGSIVVSAGSSSKTVTISATGVASSN